MKQFEIKIHNDSQTISSQKINLQKNQINTIKAMSKVNYELIDLTNGLAPDHIITKREKDDLHILFEDEDDSEIILEDFYNTEQSCLIGMSELGNYHYYTPDSGDVEDYVTLLTASNQVSGHALGSREMASAWWSATPSYKPDHDVSGHTNYVINNGKELIMVDSVAESEPMNPATNPNHDTANLDMTASNVAVSNVAVSNTTSSTPDSTSHYDGTNDTIDNVAPIEIATAEPIEEPAEANTLTTASSSNWTPWAVGIASVAGLALALGSGGKGSDAKESDNKSTDAVTTNDQNDNNNSSNQPVAIMGDAKNDTLVGSQEDEILTGGKGSDILTGGGGKDVFNYSDLSFSDLLDGSIDTITDFGNDDKIQIDSAILQNYTPSTNIFDYIAYDNNTGALSLDVDASGAASAVHFANIDNNVSLTGENFVII